MQEDGNIAHVAIPRVGNPPTLESLFRKFEIDSDDWRVLSYKINEWHQHSAKYGLIPLYQGKATLLRRDPVVCEWPAVRPVYLRPNPPLRAPVAAGQMKRAVVVADGQIGFHRSFDDYKVRTLHDRRAFACATAAITALQPDQLVILGDMLDLPDWSDHFVQSPEFAFTSQMSINWFAAWLRHVRPYCGKVVYVEGNHEARLVRCLMTNTATAYKLKPANMPAAAPLLSIRSMLGLDALGIEYVGDYPKGEYWINDNLLMIHGKKVGAKSGQTAMKMLDSPRTSIIQGHAHRQESAHVTTHSHNKTVTYGAYALGTLARLDGIVPSQNGRENWQQGIGVVDYTDDLYQVYPLNIYGGRMVMFGRQYEADVTNDPLSDCEVRELLADASNLVDATAPAA